MVVTTAFRRLLTSAACYSSPFSDVVITSGGDSFNFIFTKVEVTYFPQKPDGSADASISFAWDFAANAPF
jgi:hypothetical protein